MRRGMVMVLSGGSVVIVFLVAVLVLMTRANHRGAIEAALADYRHTTKATADQVATRLSATLRSTYEGVRTIARLPGVRGIAPHAENFDGDARRTVQEIYNNLASAVALSELYIVPVDMNPDAAESDTHSPREPITTFDELIVERNADQKHDEDAPKSDVEEIEIFEYRLMRRQLAYLREHFPTEASVRGLTYPVLCGPEVITCDNSHYSPSHPDDADRSGLVFSVPFFAPDGTLKGCVSAVMLTGALREILPDGEYALCAPRHAYTVVGSGAGPARSHLEEVERAQPASDLLCSVSIPIAFADAESHWTLWRGRPDGAFAALPEVMAARRVALMSYSGAGALGLTGLGGLVMIARRTEASRHRRAELEREVAERTSQLREQALTDKLTGLPNRTLIMDRIERAMARSGRNGDSHYAVLFLDFDRFKVVNDTLGHEAGDQLLLGIADRLRRALRDTDSVARPAPNPNTAARLGGDEFVVLLEDLSASDDAGAVAERLVKILSEPHAIAGQQVVSTASIGVVRGERHYERAADVLRDADTAMYEAKAAGKGCYVVFDGAMRERIVRRAELERDVRDAAVRGELVLHFQPIVCLSDGKVTSVEALVRWNHPRLGMVPPGEFIPIAEESGSIARVTAWVVREASAQIARWRASIGPERTPQVAVNLSRVQLTTPGLEQELAEIAAGYGVEPSALCLELTETAIVRNQKAAVEALRRMKGAGFKLALDDFGTGYSSLSTLHTFPLDTVKLDRSFIASTGMGREHSALVHAVVSLAANLGMEVVAEGVETAEQVAALQALDCRYAQGYLFGRAVPGDRIVEMLTEHRRAA